MRVLSFGEILLRLGAPGYTKLFQRDVLEAVSVPVSEALLTLPKAYGFVRPLVYDEDKQEENADV